MAGYTKLMTDAIMHAERINKNTEKFVEDVALEIKRSKAPIYALKILNSKNTQLIWPKDALPRPLKVFAAKDLKGSKKITAFIDCSNIIRVGNNERYRVNTEVLLAHIFSAKHNMMYYGIPGVFSKKSSDVTLYTRAYAKLFTHIIDYIGNISVIPDNREKMIYMASKFFLNTIMAITDEDKIEAIAVKAAGITQSQANIFNIRTEGMDFDSLPGFVDTVKEVFKMDKLTIGLVLEKWMFLYGAGTILGIEFLPSFLTMITDAYCGVYLNNQKTIEKILSKDLVEMGKILIYENTNI
jgi:hypothetical protein